MTSIDLVVSIRREHERGNLRDPSSEEAQDVERGSVSPVDVLEDECGGRRSELGHQLDRDGVRRRRPRNDLLERTARGECDVDDRAERPWREEGIACSSEHASLCAELVAEALDERRLPDARFAANEHRAVLPWR